MPLEDLLDIAVYATQVMYDPYFGQAHHFYIAATSEEAARAASRSPDNIRWAAILDGDPLLNSSHALAMSSEARRNPGQVVCDLFPDAVLFNPWAVEELQGDGNTRAFFEVPENGDDPKVCGRKGCGKAIPNDAIRMVHEKDGARAYLCQTCSVELVEKNMKMMAVAFLRSREFLHQLQTRKFLEDHPL